jgi:hypothetical protein
MRTFVCSKANINNKQLKSHKKHNMKKKMLLIIILLLIVTEVMLRLFYSDKWKVAYRPLLYRSVPVVNYGYIQDTCFSLSGKTHCINKQGFIGVDFEKKTSGMFRIAVVGSSGVAGSINLYSYYSFCPMLQKKFEDNNMNVQILNCGIDGSGRTLELFESIRYQIMNFNPDMILLEYGMPFETFSIVRENYNGYIVEYTKHDMAAKTRVEKMIDQLNVYKPGLDCLYHSYIIRGLARIYKKQAEFKTQLWRYLELYEARVLMLGVFKQTGFDMEQSISMIQELKEELAKKNIQFFLFQYGNDKNKIQVAKEDRLPLISLNLSFEQSDFFPKDSHWNEAGCKKVANRFYDLIKKHELIPKSFKTVSANDQREKTGEKEFAKKTTGEAFDSKGRFP